MAPGLDAGLGEDQDERWRRSEEGWSVLDGKSGRAMDIQAQPDQSTRQDACPEGRLVPAYYATRRVVQSHVYLKSE
jgi:hypothetical protein